MSYYFKTMYKICIKYSINMNTELQKLIHSECIQVRVYNCGDMHMVILWQIANNYNYKSYLISKDTILVLIPYPTIQSSEVSPVSQPKFGYSLSRNSSLSRRQTVHQGNESYGVVVYFFYQPKCLSSSVGSVCQTSQLLFIYLFIYLNFTAAMAADRPALSARAGWKKEKKKQVTKYSWSMDT